MLAGIVNSPFIVIDSASLIWRHFLSNFFHIASSYRPVMLVRVEAIARACIATAVERLAHLLIIAAEQSGCLPALLVNMIVQSDWPVAPQVIPSSTILLLAKTFMWYVFGCKHGS